MRHFTFLSAGLLVSIVLAAPIENKRGNQLETIIHWYADVEQPTEAGQPEPKKRELNTVISKYADIDGSAEKRNLNTVIASYNDVEAHSTSKRDEVTPVIEAPPTGTLETIIHHYADVE
ncbi:hypothetical protein BU24DRAFT_495495 [Aaosphaeria arxii CBS 175.79]|uniref:Uncharacterized protein n=1 Tax=Aaosphaeria arxii CBS 175.79 TaxID=1450172 RepID=A0A6A5XEH2_9PLEO|nr:uncharacterized protein BU24DRAFT_495495 [Aaosphaeria arxii CBS 175.79]KAF2011279.1 hypothetical protein BU24DRAFT_495495 [Aaosphaeria arxii CBS 175.79]